MPSRNPHRLKIAIAPAEISVGLPSAVIACPHAPFRITPFVRYSTTLITTPASRPPKMTLLRLVCAIASSCGRTAELCPLLVRLPRGQLLVSPQYEKFLFLQSRKFRFDRS